jgi:hypothetical protein
MATYIILSRFSPEAFRKPSRARRTSIFENLHERPPDVRLRFGQLDRL